MISQKAALTLNTLPVLEETNRLSGEIDKLRPLPSETEQRILQKLRLNWNYHSNAIEGNTLSYGETVAFLMHGLTAKGKPLKDHLDIRGHNEAINFLLGMVKDDRPFTEADIRNLHEMVLVEPYEIEVKSPSGLPTKKTIRLGEYKKEPNHVETATGEIHYYASPEEAPARMGDLVEWYRQVSQDNQVHPLVIASLFHHEFVAIHPFDDGNGRVTRLLTNLILMRYQFPPMVIRQEDRGNYYQVLSQADAGEYVPLVEYFGNLLNHSLTVYLKGTRGESLVEVEDIDKEIALFKKGIRNSEAANHPDVDRVDEIVRNDIFPLFQLLQEKFRLLSDLFFKYSDQIQYGSGSYTHGAVHPSNWNGVRAEWSQTLKENLAFRDRIVYVFSWEGFKSAKKPFNVDFIITVKFDERDYVIDFNSELEKVARPYHEQLTPDEMNQIVREIIGKVMAEIKQKAKSQSE